MGPLECESDLSLLNEDTVTFYLSSGAIKVDITKTIEKSLAFDVYFEFKSAVKDLTDGTLLHFHSGFDELIVSIFNGTDIHANLNGHDMSVTKNG